MIESKTGLRGPVIGGLVPTNLQLVDEGGNTAGALRTRGISSPGRSKATVIASNPPDTSITA